MRIPFILTAVCCEIAICIISSCNSGNAVPPKSVDLIHFEKEDTLIEKPLNKMLGVPPDGLLLCNDSILIFRNAPGKSDNHFSIWNLRQNKIIGDCLPAGRKDGQSLSFLSFGVLDNRIWVSDLMKEKLMIAGIDSFASKLPEGEFNMSNSYYSVQLLNDSIIICSGDYDSDYKISILNYLSGKMVRQLNPYTSDSRLTVLREQKSAYESFLFLKPGGEKCVLACRYADQIEIVDLKNNLIKKIKGPEGYEPEVRTVTSNDGKKISARNENTRYAFLRGKTTNEFIYLLYSGNNHLSEHLFYGNCIFVYDWDGNPVKRLVFQDDVLDFSVSADNKLLYAYHAKSKQLTVSSLSK